MPRDTGNLEFIAAKVSEIDRALKAANDERLDSFTGLLSSVESMLTDLVENIEQGGGAAAIQAIAEAMRSIKMAAPDVSVNPQINVSPTPIDVHVPQQAPPAVNVNVEPTPVTVEAVMPAMPAIPAPIIHMIEREQKGAVWEIRLPGQFGAPDRVMTITRKA
jgi:hypothetical protein